MTIAGIDEPSALAAIAELLSNGLIQQATLKSRDRYLAEGGMAARVPMVHLAGSGAVTLVDLDVPDEELIAIGKLGVANPDGTRPKIVSAPAGCDIVYRTSSNKPTWLVNLDYKPTPGVMLYAKYARGYRQGGISPNAQGVETWGPEKVDAYEIGAKA